MKRLQDINEIEQLIKDSVPENPTFKSLDVNGQYYIQGKTLATAVTSNRTLQLGSKVLAPTILSSQDATSSAARLRVQSSNGTSFVVIDNGNYMTYLPHYKYTSGTGTKQWISSTAINNTSTRKYHSCIVNATIGDVIYSGSFSFVAGSDYRPNFSFVIQGVICSAKIISDSTEGTVGALKIDLSAITSDITKLAVYIKQED